MSSNTVFVLGAGFTKAFFPNAPLMTDDYDWDGLLSKKFERIDNACRLLKLEKKREGKLINIERMMSRLDVGMPYDADHAELLFLLHEVKNSFFRRLGMAVNGQLYKDELFEFSRYCLKYSSGCITFNYDDAFDWSLSCAGSVKSAGNDPFWHPDSGYGFELQGLDRDQDKLDFDFPDEFYTQMKVKATPLLKLHGSVNWRIRFGFQTPYHPDALVHYEDWYTGWGEIAEQWTAPKDPIEGIEKDPFFVPPVLVKSAIVKEPVLKIIWSKARRLLKEASRVVFIGYSMPPTDLAARFLFSEAIRENAKIDVVILPGNSTLEKLIEENYKTLFWLKSLKFFFQDAREWINKEIKDC